MLALRGEEQGLAYLQKLNQQNVAPLAAATRAILDQVAAGEYPMMLGVSDHNAEIARRAGAPVAWLPLDAAWTTLHTIGITAGAPRHASCGALAAPARGRLSRQPVRAGDDRPQPRALERALCADFPVDTAAISRSLQP